MGSQPLKIVDRSTFQTELDALRVREKACAPATDKVARRRLPMVEVTPLLCSSATTARWPCWMWPAGRRMLIAYYFMWHAGQPAADYREGCTLYIGRRSANSPDPFPRRHLRHLRQGPYEEGERYRKFMGYEDVVFGPEGGRSRPSSSVAGSA